jgi:2-keto-4-pentenoate hydratase/2-oxohepta-3-ene-1,7-dioic acid hydratase in catechol pathway
MRLISFEHNGRPGVGIVVEGGIVDVSGHLGARYSKLRDILAANALDDLRPLANERADVRLDAIRFCPVIADAAAKILCVGVNYLPHIREMGREPPEYPVVFVRFVSSLVGHGEPLVRPLASTHYDFEGELAVVIGRRARRVRREDALEYVAGYSCFNDGSVRDYQRHGLQWTPGKNFHASGAFGPWLVTADEVPDPAALHLQTRLNGTIVQDEDVAQLCFDVPALIEYCSTWTQLTPGDVIVTGTPGGVGAGRKPPLWMQAGDSVEVEISGIGTLKNTIVDEDAA